MKIDSEGTCMALVIEEMSKITAKGQTTVPKAVRQALGVASGGKIAYRIKDGQVTLHNPLAAHTDPVLAAFLDLIARNIAAGGAASSLPPDLAAVMRRVVEQIPIDLEEELEGQVEI